MYLTPPQIAKMLRCRRETVLAWIRAGKLRALNLAGPGKRPSFRISQADFDAFTDRMAVTAAPSRASRRRQDPDVIRFY